MNQLIDNILFSFSSTTPVFIILFLGYFLKQKSIIDESFVKKSSGLVFNISLPVFLFLELIKTDYSTLFAPGLIGFVYAGIFISFSGVWLLANKLRLDRQDKGVFVQGAFRSNFAIIGLALIFSIFGEASVPKGSLVLAFIVPIFNFLSVMVLEVTLAESSKVDYKKIVLSIIKSPLILSVIVSVPFSLWKIPLNNTLHKTGEYIASLTLPLALIGIGGSLDFSKIRSISKEAINATLLKIVWIPLVMTYAAYLFGFRGDDLGIIFVFFSSPTAVVSFIMAYSMGGNSKLAANIVVLSTLGASLTTSLGIFILRITGLI